MTSLADLFAFLYGMDLQTLDRVMQEAVRILAERELESRREFSSPTVVTRVKG
jgi:hypothetical protein